MNITIPPSFLLGFAAGILFNLLILAAIITLRRRSVPKDILPRVPTPMWTPSTPTPDATYRAEIQYHLSQGNKIKAIKVYREATGASLKEAKEAVERMEGGQPISFPVRQAAPESPADLLTAIESLLRQRRKIEAIRYYREATGVGLKEAKENVEAIEKASKTFHPGDA